MQTPPADLRILAPLATVLGQDNSLINVDTTQLPDGCLAYVLANHSTWRLHKTVANGTAGYLSPASGPGAWFQESGASLFLTTVSPGTGVPGTINATSVVTASLASSSPLLSTDLLWAGQLPSDVPPGIAVTAQIDTTTVPGTVRIQYNWMNTTSGGIPVPDESFYYILVYRPT